MINSPLVENSTVGWNYPVSMFNQKNWIANFTNSNNCIRWIIELTNGCSIGMITINDIDWKNRCAFLHYKLNPIEKNRIRGDIKDALYAVIRYMFDELGFNRLEGSILEDNNFSIKLIKSMGFVEEGKYRNKVFKNAEWKSELFFSLLSNEFVRYEDNEAPWQLKR